MTGYRVEWRVAIRADHPDGMGIIGEQFPEGVGATAEEALRALRDRLSADANDTFEKTQLLAAVPPARTRGPHPPDCRCGCRVPCPCGNPVPHPFSHTYHDAMWRGGKP